MIFGQKPWTIPFGKCQCFALFKSSIFWSKKPFFSIHKIKNNLYKLLFSQKKRRKSLMFGQKPWIIPFGKSRCFALFKTLYCWSKNSSFFVQNIKKQYFLTWFLQKTQIGNISIFGQKMDYLLRKKHFCRPFKTLVFRSKIWFFLSRIPRNDLFEHNYFKNTNEKKFEF